MHFTITDDYSYNSPSKQVYPRLPLSVQSSISKHVAQKYLCKCIDTYLKNKYFHNYDDSFGVRILGDDCTLK